MTEKSNYILRGARIVDPSRGIDEVGDLGVFEGRITAPEKVKKAVEIDLTGRVLAPGFIDMHVHLRQPGETAKETIRTGTMAAAAGGFSALVAMPNTSPPADTPGTIEYVRRHTEREGVVKVYPCGCITKNSEGIEMAGIGSLKQAGIVAVSDDGRCIQNHELMRHAVEYSKTFELPVLDHCEDAILASDGVMHEGKWSTLLGMRAIPSAAEELMVARDIILARMADWKVHIQHVSAEESVDLIRNARANGISVSAEVTPHHLLLTDEEIKHFDTNFKMNPPLRAPDDIKGLIAGLKDGTISVIASDHAPHTETDKLVEFDYAPFGIVGLETTVSVCLTKLYHEGILTLPDLIAKFTTGPVEILNLPGGSLAEGVAADATILDLDVEHRIDAATFRSKSRNTPFHGWGVKGKAIATMVDGEFVHSELDGRPGLIDGDDAES